MTSIDTYAPDATTAERPAHTRQKGTLFCVACGYENPVGGNWDLHDDGEGLTRYCPNCHTAISDR